MENFVVSARKYRPSTFDTVVGQQSITNTLKNAIQNQHLAQAFLFCGPRGVGKTSCARILAKTINCMNLSQETEACDQCESCKGFNQNHSFNIHELDAASNNGVDKIRELVDQVRFAPQVGKYNIYIIDEVHMLSQAAFNAFLKTLEEPPAHALFILATTEKHKIIPTILSRCQIFDFKRIQIKDIAQHLAFVAQKEGIDAQPEALHIIAQKADGALRDALSIFDQIVSFCGNSLNYQDVIKNLNILDFDYYFKMTDALYHNDIPAALNCFDDILNNGFDGHHFINGLGQHLRNVLVATDLSTIALLELDQGTQKRYIEQSKKWTPSILLKALELCNKVDLNYRISKNQRLLVEITLMQLCSLVEDSEQQTEKKTFLVKNPSQNQAPKKTAEDSQTEEKIQHVQPSIVLPENIEEQADAKNKSIKIVNLKENLEPKTISINLIRRQKELQKNQPKQSLQDVRTTTLNQELIDQAKKQYSEAKLQEGKHHLASIINDKTIELKKDTILVIKLDNKVQEEVLNEYKNDLMLFFKDQLKNDLLSLQLEVEKIEPTEMKAYTDEEKFKKMAQKQPLLFEMKTKFNLEIDF